MVSPPAGPRDRVTRITDLPLRGMVGCQPRAADSVNSSSWGQSAAVVIVAPSAAAVIMSLYPGLPEDKSENPALVSVRVAFLKPVCLTMENKEKH